MATKKENAEALNKALGVSINPEASAPKADTLQDWADRSGTDADTVKREILTSQLETHLGIQIPGDHTAEQLIGWLASEDTEAVKAAINGADQTGDASAGTGTPDSDTPDAPDEDALTLTVQVSEKVAAYGGTYTDPDQPEGHRVIGADPVKVAPTALIHAGLKNGTLTESE